MARTLFGRLARIVALLAVLSLATVAPASAHTTAPTIHYRGYRAAYTFHVPEMYGVQYVDVKRQLFDGFSQRVYLAQGRYYSTWGGAHVTEHIWMPNCANVGTGTYRVEWRFQGGGLGGTQTHTQIVDAFSC